MDFRISLVGLLIGFLVGLTGMGGGALLAPIMILIFRVPPIFAVGTDIAYSAITKALGSVIHIRQGNVNFKIVGWLACGSIPATLLSVGFVHYLRTHYSTLIENFILGTLGFMLLIVAFLLLTKPMIMRYAERRKMERLKQKALAGKEVAPPSGRWERVYRPALTVLAGAIVGFLVGLTSVGSGTLIIVSLAFLFPYLSSKELVGTDIFQAFLLLLAGLIGYMTTDAINWNMTMLLLCGSLPGVFLGSKLSKYIPDRYLRPLLALVLAISAYNLLIPHS